MEHMQERTKSQESNPVIWIIGNSVLIDGVAACLEDRNVPNLVRWEAVDVDLDANMHTSQPNLIIFELDTPGSYMLLDLLREQPGIYLLGINQNCNQVIVLNSYKQKTRTMSDLYQIIKEISGGWE